MVIPTPNQGIPEQQGADPANLPGAQTAWDGVMENRLFQRYADAADRVARNAAPNEGEAWHLAAEDRDEQWNGVAAISLAHRSSYAFLRRTTDAAPVISSIVLVSDAIMTSALTAASTFTFNGTLIYDASTVADLRIAIAWPGGASGKSYFHGLDVAAAGVNGDAKYTVTTASATNFSFGGAGVGTLTFVKFEGRVTTVGAGNLVVQYAQQNSEATNLTVRADSYLEVIQRA